MVQPGMSRTAISFWLFALFASLAAAAAPQVYDARTYSEGWAGALHLMELCAGLCLLSGVYHWLQKKSETTATPKVPAVVLREELHPRKAYETLTGRWLYWRWVWASKRCDKADKAANAIATAWYQEQKKKIAGMSSEDVLSTFRGDLAGYGYRTAHAPSERASMRYIRAETRKRTAEKALDADFHARLERGDLLAHGRQSHKDTSEIMERSYWRGAKIDKELLFNNRMQDLVGVHWITIAIGREA